MVGIAFLALIVSISSHFPINYSGIYVAFLAALIITDRFKFIEINNCFISLFKRNTGVVTSPKVLLLQGFIGSLAILYFLVALMPEVGYDALVAHLVVPERMEYFHRWIYDPKILVWSLGPLNGNWVFTIPYVVTTSETAIRIASLGFLAVICYLIRDLMLSFNKASKEYLIAILLLLTTPLTLLESSTLFTDLIWTAYSVAGACALFKILLDESKDRKTWIYLVGIFFGMALGIKVTTLYLILPVFLLYIIAIKKIGYKFFDLFAAFMLFLLIGSISYIYSYWITKNPFFPFYNEVFKSSLYPFEKFAHPFKPGLSWDVINQITFNSGNFLEAGNGAPGFQWLLLLIPSALLIIFLRKKIEIALLLVAICFILLVFNTVGYLRYIYPAFVLLIVFIGLAIAQSKYYGRAVAFLFYFLACLAVLSNLLFFRAASGYSNISLSVIFNNIEREHYILSRVPMRKAVEIVNQINIDGSPVAILSTSPFFAGLHATPLIGWWYNHDFSKSIFDARDEESVARLLSRNNIQYVLLDDAWGGLEKQKLIKNMSDTIEKIGNIAILRINSRSSYQYNLMDKIKFPQDWQHSLGVAVLQNRYIKVTVASPSTVVVGVEGGRRYKYIAEAKCADVPTEGRLQINWADSRGRFISPSITTFQCKKDFQIFEVEMRSPPNAVAAIVYASSHTDQPIIFKKIQLME